MMNNRTQNFQLKFLAQNQAHKELIINENLIHIDSMLNKGVISMNCPAPPSKNEFGDMYIIPSNAEALWSEHINDIAFYHGDTWFYFPPKEGRLLWVCDLEKLVVFSKNQWQSIYELKSESTDE